MMKKLLVVLLSLLVTPALAQISFPGGVSDPGPGGGTNGTVNTGSTGQIGYYGSSGTAISGSANTFISANGSIGIGAAPTINGLDVVLAGTAQLRANDSTNTVDTRLVALSGAGIVGTWSASPLLFNLNGNERMRLQDTHTTNKESFLYFTAYNLAGAQLFDAVQLNPGLIYWDTGHEQTDLEFGGYRDGTSEIFIELTSGCILVSNVTDGGCIGGVAHNPQLAPSYNGNEVWDLGDPAHRWRDLWAGFVLVDGGIGVGTGSTNPAALFVASSTAGGITNGYRATNTSLGSPSINFFPGTGTPVAGVISFGDGSGWEFHFRTNAGTDLAKLTDTGGLTLTTTSGNAFASPGFSVDGSGNVTGLAFNTIPFVSNVQSTGTPGVNGSQFFIYHAPTSQTSDVATLRADRNSNYSGGTIGSVQSAIWGLSTVSNAGETDDVWSILGELHNSSTAILPAAQNVAVAGYAFKAAGATTSFTWGANFALTETANSPDPTSGSISTEFDVFANGSDSHSLRIIADFAGGKVNGAGTTPTITYGWRVGAQDSVLANATFVHGGYFNVATYTDLIGAAAGLSTTNGLDLHSATIATNAIWLADSQRVTLDTAAVRYLFYATGSLVYHGNGGNVFSVDDSGDVTTNGYLQTFGHFRNSTATAPGLSSCGTNPAIIGDDKAGTVTMGTGSPTGCVITFNVAYTSAPSCTVSWQATPLASQSYAVSNTAITLTQTGTSSNKINYTCMAQSGG